MSELRWQLDGLAFRIALEVMGRDRLPYPLSYRHPRVEHRDDYERLRARTAEGLQRIFDERLHRALTVLLEPEVRVEVHGFHGPRADQVVRIHAGISGQVATVAVQHPGPTREHGRDVVLTMCYSHTVATEIAARLPRCAGGRHAPFSARRSDLDRPVYARHPNRLAPEEELARFVHRPRAGTGEISVHPGIAIDARPTNDGHAFIWMDYPDDGRYLLVNHDADAFSISPAPVDELVRQLQHRIEALRTRSHAW
ncbi:ESX secretion-associated protein EspG [Nocardia higoensis]|uniref:ESX secretion-associated protein EspG n=1 Tax=Nocardia higoensis TaxID=228599 RepID=UPI0002F94ACF|nr:ESX secretion-associated protein EspG [Nocardia higoensis]